MRHIKIVGRQNLVTKYIFKATTFIKTVSDE